MFKCKDVMTHPVISVKPTDTIEEVANRLLRHHVSGFPVIDEAGHAVGVISEFDLLRIMYDPETNDNLVHEYMTKNIFTIEADAHLTDAAARLTATVEKNVLVQLEHLRTDRKSTRLNSSHTDISRMPSSA